MGMPRLRPVGTGHNSALEPTRLEEWRHLHGYSMQSLADTLGVNYYTVKRWCNGSHMPSLVRAFAIDRITKGDVPAEYWMTTRIGQAEMKHVKFFVNEAKEDLARRLRALGRTDEAKAVLESLKKTPLEKAS